MLRVDTIQTRLRRLEEVVTELRDLAKLAHADLRGSLRSMWAVERGLQLGIEILLDIGNHILSAQYGTGSDRYQDIIEQLAGQGILDEDLHRRLRGIAGFRNILVHDYLRLDPDRVEEALATAPRDFDDFALAIRRWFEGRATKET
ncbi:MAG TPA: DUF86 domain-containing protein [Thermoanaerobaculia bacterium]|nr:DUF86 domain-containing protein [Thermoanaerobaculia bacterium]